MEEMQEAAGNDENGIGVLDRSTENSSMACICVIRSRERNKSGGKVGRERGKKAGDSFKRAALVAVTTHTPARHG
jgi:hypothetical protein